MQNHIISLIDTVSFAIAGKSRIGATSISDVIRKAAPIGSVEVKQVAQRPPLRPETSQRYDEISTVTRAQAFKTAADKLAAASNRLKDESQRQAQYWEQMAVLRTNGWPLSRLPSNDRLLVLHFACGESGQQYQSKGAATLRQEDSGNLILPGQVDARQQKRLSVTVQRTGVKTGRFICRSQSQAAQMQIEDDLVRAKESLFQEELFNELAREARLVANLGVKIRSSCIEVELRPELIAYVNYAVDNHETLQEYGEDQHLAESIAMGLRLMLVAEYEHKHTLRSTRSPQPLTQAPRPPTEYAILRPLLARLRHDSTITTVIEKLEQYQAALARAGFSFSCKHVEKDDSPVPGTEALQELRKIVTTSIQLQLPAGDTLTIVVETYLGPPAFGTTFLSTTYTNICGTIACAQTSSTEDVTSFVEGILAQEVASIALNLTEPDSQWICVSQFPLEFKGVGTASRSNSLKLKCSNGAVAVWSRKGEDPSTAAMYSSKLTQLLTGDGQQEVTELELPELLRQWLP